jgi:YD repeat-containing protein
MTASNARWHWSCRLAWLVSALALGMVLLPARGAGAQGPPLPAGPPPSVRSAHYYVSNALGSPLEEIGWYRQDEFSYVLIVERSGQLETRRLVHEAKELRRWERTPTEEREFVEGKLSEQLLFDALGRVEEERQFDAGVLQSRRVLHYGAAGVSWAEVFDGEGRLIFEDHFLLSSRGELLRVDRQTPEGAQQELALGGRGGRIYEERYAADGQAWVNRYDDSGRLISRELWQDGVAVERQSLEYGEKGLKAVQKTDVPSGRTEREEYDEAGRLAGTVVEEKGRQVQETRFSRDEQGRVVEKLSRGGAGLEQWLYSYAADGHLEQEVYKQRGSVRQVTYYATDGTREEDLYKDGEVVLRVQFRGGLKLREETLQGGKVVRAKEYE